MTTAATGADIEVRSSELAIAPGQTSFTDVQAAALRHLGLQGDDADEESLQFSDADLQVFFHQCQRTGLDPFARQIYMIMRKEFGRPKPTIQTGIDGFRKIGRDAARRHGATVSKQAPIWLDSDGNEHRVWVSSEPPAAALVNLVVDGVDNIAVCNYREFVQVKRNGDPNSMWRKMPANQLAKCAESAAYRMAFPSDFSGISSPDEPRIVIDSDGNPDGPPPRRRQHTGRGGAGRDAALDDQAAAAVGGDTDAPPAADGEPMSTPEQHQKILAGLNTLFPDGTKGRAEYVQAAVRQPVTSVAKLTAAQADDLLTVIAEHIDHNTTEK